MRAKVAIPAGLHGHVFRHSAQAHPHWLGPPHRHEELEFNLVIRGSAIGVVRSQRVHLEPGVMNWLFPAQEHIFVDCTADYEMWVAVFRPKLVRENVDADAALLRKRNPDGELAALLRPSDRSRLHEHMLALQQVTHRADHFNAGLRWLLLEAWRAFQHADTAPLGPRLDVHPAVEQASRLIRTDPATAELDTLAERCGVSPAWLSRIFHRQLGVTLTHYRQRQRLERLRLLAAQSRERNLTYLALKAGFGSYTQCYRAAVQTFGRTPKELVDDLEQR